MKLFESLKNKKFLLFNIFFTLYIAINLIGGERGLISYFDKKKLLEELETKEKMLTNKLQDLEKNIILKRAGLSKDQLKVLSNITKEIFLNS